MSCKPCECSLILPTRNRAAILSDTLNRLVALPDRHFEIIVCDNGSTDATTGLRKHFPQVRWIELGENLGAAARNVGAAAARGWLLLMLDDDSWPDAGVITRLVWTFRDRVNLGAAGLRVKLADTPDIHDAGGVAGIFFNCGGAIRRKAFLDVGGYPIDYDYYVEEYDLSARLWASGWCIEPLGDLIVRHRRVSVNRDNDRMLRLLVRNNMRFWQRYAPSHRRDNLISEMIQRYHRVAEKEDALAGFEEGLREGRAWIADVRPRPLTEGQFEMLMGLGAARARFAHWADKRHVKKISVWTRGKGCELLIDLLRETTIAIDAVYEAGVRAGHWRGVSLRPADAFCPVDIDGLVVGSLSPGTAEDMAKELRRKHPALAVFAPATWGTTTAAQSLVSVS